MNEVYTPNFPVRREQFLTRARSSIVNIIDILRLNRIGISMGMEVSDIHSKAMGEAIFCIKGGFQGTFSQEAFRLADPRLDRKVYNSMTTDDHVFPRKTCGEELLSGIWDQQLFDDDIEIMVNLMVDRFCLLRKVLKKENVGGLIDNPKLDLNWITGSEPDYDILFCRGRNTSAKLQKKIEIFEKYLPTG